VNKRRKLIREIITDINRSSDQHSNSIEPANPLPRAVDQLSDQHSNSIEPANPLPGAVDRLSDPTFNRELPFPSMIDVVPGRFKDDGTAEAKWLYMGRTKFKELLEKLKAVRKAHSYTTLWLYGTQGYGKSHLLAVLVCYLAAQDERVVYIPDCREWLRAPVEDIRVAMLFAWADDITTQKEVMTLNTEDEIEAFFKRQENVIFVVDQLNALTESDGLSEEIKRRGQLHSWLMRFTSKHTAVFSSSANYKEYLELSKEQTSNCVVRAYGGLDRVSHRRTMSQ
jgi:NACHT domain